MGPLSGVALEGDGGAGMQIPDGDVAAVQRADDPVAIGGVEESVLHGLRREENAIGVFWDHGVPQQAVSFVTVEVDERGGMGSEENVVREGRNADRCNGTVGDGFAVVGLEERHQIALAGNVHF